MTDDTGQGKEASITKTLEEHAVAIGGSDPQESMQLSDALSTRLARGRIIGLGEATHGTREFFRLKHRLFRHLVRNEGARVFAIEANFPETLDINDYVLHGTGDPREALENIYFWTWNVESVLSFIEWMRSFNEGRPLDDRVRFYGFDAQYTTGAVSKLEAYLDDVDANLPSSVRDALGAVDDDGTNPDQDEETERHLEAGAQVVPALREHLDSHKEAYIERAGRRAWELACQHVAVIDQATEYRQVRNTYEGEDSDTMERILRVRDRAMADNVEWLLDFEDTEPIVLWAHDAHINCEKHSVRGSGATETPMGGFLRRKFDEEYVPVGFSFGRGSFQALTDHSSDSDTEGYDLEGQTLQSPVPGTIDEQLDTLDQATLLVDVASAATDERLTDLLCSPQPHFSVGAKYEPGTPGDYLTEYTYEEAFDILCYVEATTRARPVDADLPEP